MLRASKPGSTIVILPKVYLCVQNYSTQLYEVFQGKYNTQISLVLY